MTKMERQTLRKAGWADIALLLQPVHSQPTDQGISVKTREKAAATDRKLSVYTVVGYRVQIEERCLV